MQNKIRRIICDPSAESFQLQLKKDFRDKGWACPLKDAENDVLNGIRVQARMMKSGEYAIYKPCCPETVAEKYAYSWNKKKQMLGIDEPLKTNDHCCDNERYVLYTEFGQKYNYDISNFVN